MVVTSEVKLEGGGAGVSARDSSALLTSDDIGDCNSHRHGSGR